MSREEENLKIFISYSRTNSDVKDVIERDLKARDFEVIVDTSNLNYGEQWKEELSYLIQSCDTVVWLISPQSVGSDWVNWELGELRRTGKRLVPVMITETSVDSLPKAIGDIQFLPRNGVYSGEADLEDLVRTLITDQKWIQEHTRLGTRARTWRTRDRRPDDLLSGKALKDAEDWRARRPMGVPPPDPNVLELIAASQARTKHRQRNWIAGLAISAVFFLGLAITAYIQRGIAVGARDDAKTAQILAEDNAKKAARNAERAERNAEQARKNEGIANRRAARLAVTTARTLREQGFNRGSMLVLLDAAKQFDDATAPAALRIELEKALQRASFNKKSVAVAAREGLSVRGGRIIDTDTDRPSVSEILSDAGLTASTGGKPYDCNKIYAEPLFETTRPDALINPDWGAEAVIDVCIQKGGYVVLDRDFQEAHSDHRFIAIYRVGYQPEKLFDFRKPQDFAQYDWIGGDDTYRFAFLNEGKIIVRGSDEELVLPVSVEPKALRFVDAATLLSLTATTGDDGETIVGDLVVNEFDLAPDPVFDEPGIGDGRSVDPKRGCEQDERRNAWVCKAVSTDGAWTVQHWEGTVQLFKSENPDEPHAVISIDPTTPRVFQNILSDGPDLLLHNKSTNVIEIWSPPAEGTTDWKITQHFAIPGQFSLSGIDRSGDRVLLGGEVRRGTAQTVLLYSVSARQIWRGYLSYPEGGEVALKANGDVYTNQYDIFGEASPLTTFPPLSKLVALTIDRLPDECSAKTDDLRTSACWPAWID